MSDYELPALVKFAKVHPEHVRPNSGGEPYEVKTFESPTTDHIRVQCGCGYIERYPFVALGGPLPERRRSNHG